MTERIEKLYILKRAIRLGVERIIELEKTLAEMSQRHDVGGVVLVTMEADLVAMKIIEDEIEVLRFAGEKNARSLVKKQTQFITQGEDV